MSSTKLTWLENNTPVSTHFDDSYFSRADGQAETQDVFIGGNGLPERWQEGSSFTIGELGFGTGLNFLETLQQWNTCSSDEKTLTFVSFELYPIAAEDILKTIERWDELVPFAEILAQSWPPKKPCHKVTFDKAELQLYVGDARELIHSWQGKADAWYLDGFSPAKNPELWDVDLLRQVYEHTVDGGTFSTYTSAGFVKRNLISAGFEVQKVPGFRYKRERLQGTKL